MKSSVITTQPSIGMQIPKSMSGSSGGLAAGSAPSSSYAAAARHLQIQEPLVRQGLKPMNLQVMATVNTKRMFYKLFMLPVIQL